MEKLYFVTSNEEKAEEARMILEMPVEIRKADLVEIQSLDLKEIVKDKARQAFEIVGESVIVDDVGFFLEAWNGFPGPFRLPCRRRRRGRCSDDPTQQRPGLHDETGRGKMSRSRVWWAAP